MGEGIPSNFDHVKVIQNFQAFKGKRKKLKGARRQTDDRLRFQLKWN